MITVVGATGGVGSLVARKLLAAGENVRAISRSAERLAQLTALGAEPTIIDSVLDQEAMTLAFQGSIAAYTMAPPTGTNVPYDAAGAVMAEAAAAAGLTHVVNLSAFGAHRPDATGHSHDFVLLEDALNAVSGLNVLHLRPVFFMTSFYSWIDQILTKGEVRGLFRGDVPVPRIASSDMADIAANALIRRDFAGQTSRELQGQRDLSMVEAAAIIGCAINRPDLHYSQVSEEEWLAALVARGISPQDAQHMNEMYTDWNRGVVETAEPRSGLNTTPTTFETFVAEDFVPRYEAAKQAR
jgi:uncharacterized protein YbjT (DUF2867 family)